MTVCLPALNEAATIGPICRSLTSRLMVSIVDEVIVIDSGSVDDTAAVARSAGADVYDARDILPEHGGGGGKGAALWKSLWVAKGDLMVWVDSDTRNFTEDFVTALIDPLLLHPDVVLCKAFYERPLDAGDELFGGGGRVTEVLARPLINAFAPDLAGIIQPLSGEYCMRRDAALAMPFLTGYAVEIGMLLHTYRHWGVDAIAQSDLGVRIHRTADPLALGRMAAQVLAGFMHAVEPGSRSEVPGELTQFDRDDGKWAPTRAEVAIRELPPMASVLADLT